MKRYDNNGMTFKEREIYNFIVNFKKINGYSPSVYEIAKGCYTSRCWVSEVMGKLQNKGYIKFDNKKRRNIVVTKFLKEVP